MIKEVSKLYGIDDIVVYPIIKDSKKEFIRDNGIRLKGIRQISLRYELELKETKKPCEICEKLKSITFIIDNVRLSQQEINELSNDYCFVEAQILDTQNDGGDIHFCLYKCILNIKNNQISGICEFPLHKFDNYRKLMDIKINDKPIDLIAREDLI